MKRSPSRAVSRKSGGIQRKTIKRGDHCLRFFYGQDGRDRDFLGARVIHPDKKGYGAAYLAAFPHARGTYVVIGDGDDTYDFSQIPALIAPLEKGADMVVDPVSKGRSSRER
jgi:glycosyltransferase involved in cell wall biosynthesis